MTEPTKPGGLAVEAYRDLAGPAARRVGALVDRALGLALAPVDGVLWTAEQALDWARTQAKARLAARGVADDAIVPPPAVVVGAVVSGIQAAAGNAELVAMYAELLTSAMDRATADRAHPAFAEIIRQLVPDEARLFAHVRAACFLRLATWSSLETHRKDDLRTVRIAEGYERLAREAGCADVAGVRASVGNLVRLGLVTAGLQESPTHDVGARASYDVDLTDFGAAFGRACLPTPASAATGAQPVGSPPAN